MVLSVSLSLSLSSAWLQFVDIIKCSLPLRAGDEREDYHEEGRNVIKSMLLYSMHGTTSDRMRR